MKPNTVEFYTVLIRGKWNVGGSFDWFTGEGPLIETQEQAFSEVLEKLETFPADIDEVMVIHHQPDLWGQDVTEEVMAKIANHYEEKDWFPDHDVMREARDEWEAYCSRQDELGYAEGRSLERAVRVSQGAL